MNKSAFLKLIQQASNISDQQTEELEKMALAFPYCQTAHLLLAKSAYDKGSMLSAQRLRRAASYATNRQILKRIIYTTPETPVFDEQVEQAQPEVAAEMPASSAVPLYSNAEVPVQVYEEVGAPVEIEETSADDASEAIQEALEEHPNATDAQILNDKAEKETEYDASESELLSLLTINSLSASFTDLLAQEPDPELIEETSANVELEEAHDIQFYVAEPLSEDEVKVEEHSAIAVIEKEAVVEDTHPEDAVVNHISTEIDRMYAEDALGYWMGSSRLGEQLQLKDEYTRPKPHSFHPELILEYNKTHELEKAIQPTENVLSQQLDIIDQFLKLNPRLKTMANLKIKEEPQEDLSLKSSKIKKTMASENLAIIFIKQGKVKKAIKIYEQLILKNPEKKTYFAEQIEKLQN